MHHQTKQYKYNTIKVLIIWLTISITTNYFINKYYGQQKDRLKQQ